MSSMKRSACVSLEVGDDIGIAPGEQAKLRIVVRVRQHATRVEDEVRVQRHAALKPNVRNSDIRR